MHYYERYAWIVTSIFFVFLAGFAGRYIENLPMGSGKTELVNVMTFGATVLGSSISWGPFSADYATYMKEDTSKVKLFLYTFLGTSQICVHRLICRCLLGSDVGDVVGRGHNDCDN
jgi:purine-cytosine permease-like protein